VRVQMGYPQEKDEISMLRTHGIAPPAPYVVLSPTDALQLQSIAARVHVEEDLYAYAVALCQFTRQHPRVVLGASPRASLGLLRAAKACAVLGGRGFVTPDDVRSVAPHVVAHRLILVPELEGDTRARASLVEEAITKVSYRRAAR
jgi:MoxR-like ATPase